MRKELYSTVLEKVGLNIQAISSDTTTNGAIIDTKGFESVFFVFQSATITDGTYTALIQEGDESDLSDASAVADADLVGTEANAAFAAADDNEVRRIAYVGGKRYVRFNVVSASTTTGGTVGAVAVLGNPNVAATTTNS